MNSVSRESKHRLSKLAANIALSLAFGAIGVLSSVILTSVTEGFGFYSWLLLTLVGGAFLVRALFDILTISDKTVGLFMARLGIRQRLSKKRMAKDLICIIATILATAAVFPFLKALGTVGTMLKSVTTIVAIGTIFLFVYDIMHKLYQILCEKASAVADWLVHKPGEEI